MSRTYSFEKWSPCNNQNIVSPMNVKDLNKEFMKKKTIHIFLFIYCLFVGKQAKSSQNKNKVQSGEKTPVRRSKEGSDKLTLTLRQDPKSKKDTQTPSSLFKDLSIVPKSDTWDPYIECDLFETAVEKQEETHKRIGQLNWRNLSLDDNDSFTKFNSTPLAVSTPTQIIKNTDPNQIHSDSPEERTVKVTKRKMSTDE